MALGVANLTCVFSSSFPISGSFSRSSINLNAGSKSRNSMLITTIFIVLILIFLNKLFYWIPIPATAAVVVSAIMNLINLFEFKETFFSSPLDFIVMFITFIITILVETAIGLISGIFTFLLIKSIIAYSDHSQAAKIDKIDSRGSINDEAQYLLSLNDSDNSDP